MDAVSLSKFGDVEHFCFSQIPIPKPKHEEVRIRVKAAAFNPVDVKIRKGDYGGQLPIILGADCSGIIDAVGEGVSKFLEGDEVYAMSFGRCSNGSYAQYVCLPYQFVVKKPTNLTFEQAACIPLAALTAYRATEPLQQLNKAVSLFIAGAAGGVGCMTVQLARYFHGGPIYTVAGSKETKLFLEKKLNIREKNILIYQGLSEEELREKLLALNQGNFFGGVIDLVGKEMKSLCLSLVDFSGHVSSIVPEDLSFNLMPWFHHNLSLHCVFVGTEAYYGKPESWEIYQKHLSHITELLDSNQIFAPHCTVLGRLSVCTVHKAHQLLESGRVKGKLVMVID